MDTVLLGVIAISVLTMATIQVAAIVVAARAAKRLGSIAERIERDLRPILSNLQSVSADAARTTALAAATVERADKALQDAARRVERALSAVPALIESARDGFNVMAGLRTLLNVFRDMRHAPRRRPAAGEEEDALFIG